MPRVRRGRRQSHHRVDDRARQRLATVVDEHIHGRVGPEALEHWVAGVPAQAVASRLSRLSLLALGDRQTFQLRVADGPCRVPADAVAEQVVTARDLRLVAVRHACAPEAAAGFERIHRLPWEERRSMLERRQGTGSLIGAHLPVGPVILSDENRDTG